MGVQVSRTSRVATAELSHRLAGPSDIPALRNLIILSIDTLQQDFLSREQIIQSHKVMGLDTQLIADGTYFAIERAGALAGCGGWSRRATPYGGDASAGRDDRLLDPQSEPARIRAMYTHPDHVRQGVGRLILQLCENAAGAAGFESLELTATLAGEPLYRAYGFTPVAQIVDDTIPLVRMRKKIS